MKKIYYNLKYIMNGNYLFMSLVALIFGIFSVHGSSNAIIFAGYEYKTLLLKGNIFLFIIYSSELSKDLLQREKVSKMIEWFLGNGIKTSSICLLHSITLFIATIVLLIPLFTFFIIMLGMIRPILVLDYLLFGLLCCVIINISIIFTKNMNRLKGLSLKLSLFYFICFVMEVLLKLNVPDFPIPFILKYIVGVTLIVILMSLLTKERVTSSYF